MSATDKYRKQQGLERITQSYDPVVLAWTRRAAQETGADPVAMLATALQESGARRGAVGDQGTSFGPFQHHRGGALGANSPAWANSYAAVLERAKQFARLKIHGGPGAAALQRPRDPSLYAQGVQSHLEQARAILGRSAPVAPSSSQGDKRAAPGGAGGGGGGAPSLPQRTALLQGLLADAPVEDLLSLVQEAGGQGAAPGAVPVSSPGAVPTPKNTVTELAKHYIGTKYVWGGANPKGFDCSGLLQYVWNQAGVKIPRTTYQQIKAGRAVAPDQIQPGDAVFFGSAKDPHHVGMALGGGKFIEAPRTGLSVRISELAGRSDIVAVRRFQ